jgi:regulator of CtrA degradation
MSEFQFNPPRPADPIAFGERAVNSELFRELFREGMGLVEETANYLDGAGRAESRQLSRAATLSYSTESMRLTTRLMQIASWLLLQRAVSEGELSLSQANAEKNRVRLDSQQPAMAGPLWEELPATLRSLIERTGRLNERVRHMDRAVYCIDTIAANPANVIARDLDRLADAFGARRFDS